MEATLPPACICPTVCLCVEIVLYCAVTNSIIFDNNRFGRKALLPCPTLLATCAACQLEYVSWPARKRQIAQLNPSDCSVICSRYRTERSAKLRTLQRRASAYSDRSFSRLLGEMGPTVRSCTRFRIKGILLSQWAQCCRKVRTAHLFFRTHRNFLS